MPLFQSVITRPRRLWETEGMASGDSRARKSELTLCSLGAASTVTGSKHLLEPVGPKIRDQWIKSSLSAFAALKLRRYPKELQVSSLCYEQFHAIGATNYGLPDCPVS